MVGDFRIFVRMWGLAGLYMWARGLWYAPLGKDAGVKENAVRKITWAQIGSLVLFQVLENGAYLASKGVLTSDVWSGEYLMVKVYGELHDKSVESTWSGESCGVCNNIHHLDRFLT